MTDAERLSAAISLAVFFHFLIVLYQPPEKETPQVLRLETISQEDSLLNPERSGAGTGLSTPNAPDTPETEQRNKKRQALLQYLDDVERAIHARRLSTGRPDLIGATLSAFTIYPDGTFGNEKIIKSSGNVLLDKDALAAVKAASGVVKRPALIGNSALEISFWIKYQYDLN